MPRNQSIHLDSQTNRGVRPGFSWREWGSWWRAGWLAAIIVVAGLATDTGAQQAADPYKSAPICWTPAQLSANKSEEEVRIRVPGVLREPPIGEDAQPVPIASNQRGSIRRVKLADGQKLVALTFDLCERLDEITGYQGGIVDYLRKKMSEPLFLWAGSGS